MRERGEGASMPTLVIANKLYSSWSLRPWLLLKQLGKKFGGRDRGQAVARDVARFEAILRESRARFGQGGPFLFGAFSAADAMYAPVATRLDTYSIPVAAETRAYM